MSKFYVDDIDYLGLVFWYEDAKQQAKEIEKSYSN